VISDEIVRNMSLALVCVFLATLVLIADVLASLIVVSSVMLALVNVGGFMFFWDMDVEIVSAVNITLAVGLAVDYSAHIAHTFMVRYEVKYKYL